MRGFGPFSESVMMDKCLREVTRDYSKILGFIKTEKDDKKRDALLTLYHSLKYYADTWDGATEEARTDPTYARHTVAVWEMMLKQENSRKIFIVSIGGVTSGPNVWYYGYWGTCRGVNKAQMSAMEAYLAEMRAKMELPSIDSVETATPIGDADDDDEDEKGNQGPGPSGKGPDTKPDSDHDDDDDDDDDDAIEPGMQRMTLEPRNQANNFVNLGEDGRVATIDTEMIPVDHDDGINWVPNPIAQSFNDSGLAHPTIESAQSLPKPNVTIDLLDETPNDGFSDESTNWFDTHAARIIADAKTSTPANPPAKGKITIEIIRSGYSVTCDEWETCAHFTQFPLLQRFLFDIVKGPTSTRWYNGSRKLRRKNFTGLDFGPNFPNFDLDGYSNEIISPQPRPLENGYYVVPFSSALSNYRNTNRSSIDLPLPPPRPQPRARLPTQGRSNVQKQRLGAIGRQHNVRRSPNPNNYRLLGRRGSRGESIDDDSLENMPLSAFPASLQREAFHLRERIRSFKDQYSEAKAKQNK